MSVNHKLESTVIAFNVMCGRCIDSQLTDTHSTPGCGSLVALGWSEMEEAACTGLGCPALADGVMFPPWLPGSHTEMRAGRRRERERGSAIPGPARAGAPGGPVKSEPAIRKGGPCRGSPTVLLPTVSLIMIVCLHVPSLRVISY